MSWIVTLLLFATSASAEECIEQYNAFFPKANKCESAHALTTGSGVVSPSVLAVLGENPAGLAYNRVLKGHISFYQPDVNQNWRSSFVAADGKDLGSSGGIGGGLGIHKLGTSEVPTSGVTSTAATVLSSGIAADIKKINAAIGFSGRYVLSGNPYYKVRYPEANSRTTLGVLFNSTKNVRFGISAHDLNQRNSLIALGASTSLGRDLFFLVDTMASSPNNLKGIIKPTFGFNASKLQFSLGANLAINSSTTYWSNSAVSAGLAFMASKEFRVVAYYNRIELAYVGITYDFSSK